MRTAILLTGALRTIKKTIGYFQRHLLQSIPDFQQTGDIFLCVQNDTTQPDTEWETWFHQTIHPRSIHWINRDSTTFRDWERIRDQQIATMTTIGQPWRDYLARSGSMIEYYQLQCAYMDMVRIEQQRGIPYDYVVRARTDTIYCQPLDFHWLAWSEGQVAARMDGIRREMRMSGIPETDAELLRVFMATIVHDIVLPNLDHLFLTSRLADTDTLLDQPLTPSRLRAYIHHGRYIITLRCNNLYFVRRSLFSLIPALGTYYGQLPMDRLEEKEKPYYFNAENQFVLMCSEAQLSKFDYSSLFEEMSIEPVHAWKEEMFFDMEGQLINPRMLYCVVRK